MVTFARELTFSNKLHRMLFTGVFISNEDFDEFLRLRNKFLSEKKLPKISKDCFYGWDYSGRIVKLCPISGREELDIYFTKEEMFTIRKEMEVLVGKYDFPKSTKRCVVGIQKNREITIAVCLE